MPIWEALMRGFDLYHVGDDEVNARLSRIARQLQERSLRLDDLVTLAQIADTGITNIEVEEHAIPPQLARLITRMLTPSADDVQDEQPDQSSEEERDLSNFIARNLFSDTVRIAEGSGTPTSPQAPWRGLHWEQPS